MKRINENDFAKTVSEHEGLVIEVNIAQIKEVLCAAFEGLAREWTGGNEAGVIELLRKHIAKSKKRKNEHHFICKLH